VTVDDGVSITVPGPAKAHIELLRNRVFHALLKHVRGPVGSTRSSGLMHAPSLVFASAARCCDRRFGLYRVCCPGFAPVLRL
jgi:hypothetical protein